MKFYRLNENKEPEEVDMLEVGSESLQKTYIGPYFISTIFMSIDHNFGDDGDPVLFETMVFHEDSGGMERYMERYTTYTDAIAGHERVVYAVREAVSRDETDLYKIVEELENCIE